MRKVRRKISIFKIVRFVIILFFVGLCLVILLSYRDTLDDSDTEVLKDRSDVLKNDKVSMVMVGDNLIHASIYDEALNNGDGKYDFSPMYSYIREIVSDYDIGYCNQETILGGSDIGVSSYPAFNSPYEVGDALVNSGFNLISLATNHTLDRGERAVINSRNYWNDKSDVLAVGSYSSNDEKNKIDVREVNNIKYTMLNYTYGTNGIKVDSGKEYLVNVWPVTGVDPGSDIDYQNYKEQIRKDVDRVRNKVDLLIVAMHWGVEYQNKPNNYQVDAANYLASLGVDIVIGTHPHVIQPVTWIGDTLVIYSLGNFLSAHEVVNMANRVGLMTSLDIVKDKDGNIKIDNLSNELLYTYYTKDYKDIKVIPFSKINEEYLSNYRVVWQEYRDIVVSMNRDIRVVPLGS